MFALYVLFLQYMQIGNVQAFVRFVGTTLLTGINQQKF